MARAQRTGEPLPVVLCDVDHFKLFNDHYGHLAGDDCLKKRGATQHSVCKRPTDLMPVAPAMETARPGLHLRDWYVRSVMTHAEYDKRES